MNGSGISYEDVITANVRNQKKNKEIENLKQETERLNKQIEEYQKALDETTSEKMDLENIIKEVREDIEREITEEDNLIYGISTCLKQELLEMLNKVGSDEISK